MPRTRFLLLIVLIAAVALPASALADPGAIDRVSQGAAGGNGAAHVDQGRLSADGRCVAFVTAEKLLAEDPNTRNDIYERCDGSTRLVSTGPAAGAGTASNPFMELRQISDAGCVLFYSSEKLTDDDGDTRPDLFKRCGGTIERVSQGPNGGEGPEDVIGGEMSADGLCVAFLAHEKLTADDGDTIPDIYERCGSTTKRVTQGPAGGDASDGFPNLEQVTDDGACVLFTTPEKLTDDDHDDQSDAYARCGSTTRKMTPGDGAFPVSPTRLSQDGQCLNFETEEPLASTDTDTEYDIYTACGANLLHVSTGPASTGGAFSVSGRDVSYDASCVAFETSEHLTSDDSDTAGDVYKRCGASLERVSKGDGGNAEIDAEGESISPDGRCMTFTSAEHITADDTDTSNDLFERCGDTTERVAQGPSGGNGSFEPQAIAISTDGTRVIFTTDEQLTGDDTNDVTDIYERSNGQTTKVSPAQKSASPYGSNPSAASADASRVLFSRFDRLADDDTDDFFDIYLATIAPTAATGDATDVSMTGATLHGTSSGDPATKYHFVVEGSATPEADAPVGTGIKAVSATVTGLAPGTTYRYRLVATSAGGTTTGVERVFKTAALPPSGGSDNSGDNGG